MAFGLERGQCTPKDLQRASKMVPKSLEPYVIGMNFLFSLLILHQSTVTCRILFLLIPQVWCRSRVGLIKIKPFFFFKSSDFFLIMIYFDFFFTLFGRFLTLKTKSMIYSYICLCRNNIFSFLPIKKLSAYCDKSN